MIICIPLAEDKGLNSAISDHFGSAPYFLIYDLDAKTHTTVLNANSQHDHGTCNPLSVLSSYKLDAVICNGIGQGAISKLTAVGIKAYLSDSNTANDAMKAFIESKLSELSLEQACSNHNCH